MTEQEMQALMLLIVRIWDEVIKPARWLPPELEGERIKE
jgi:hypothetical protein